ncbi:MAG: UDP-glucose/GDP-mannose dehydrogenase family protein [Fimbriimonadaceae bacterium]|nr:UDP-glucose/GDP-mannose dehydrogenase family protein [Chthonomonadaceae bacterium]MCO5295570.1 UDP-glucose/GDP-mannose dehydrogenase family protein [Fimbriimonadaceae bacterium]
MKVAVVGTGYVGLVTGVVLADLGNEVICVDNDREKVAKLRQGIPPIYEPGIEELLKRTLADGFLSISEDIADATRKSDIVFIAVGTPPAEDGTPDMTAVKAVANAIAQAIDKYTVVVNKSTVPVGSGGLVAGILASHGVDPSLFDVVSNPEFLREGSAIYDTRNPDRVVIGAKNPEAAQKLVELYEPLQAPTYITDLESAELIKYASNSFLAMKISFINAISRLCEAAGANVADVAKGMGADKRIGDQFLGAGLGWGGSCFPKDVQGLIKVAAQLGYDFKLLQAVWDINEDQTLHFVKRIEDRLGGFEGKRVGLLGLAFKPNTDDIRDAKSLVIIDKVLSGGGSVVAFDPVADVHVKGLFPQVEYVDNVFDVAAGVDVLVLVTEWNEFRQIDLKRLACSMRQKILFDGRRVYSPAQAEKAGLEYYTIGS